MKCSKGLLLLLFSISFTQLSAQILKRKYRGIYTGQIPSYQVHMDTSTYRVNQTDLTIHLTRDSLFLEMGTYRHSSVYSIERKEKNFILTAAREQSGIPEEFLLNSKTKTIIRKGLYPQPDAILARKGKLPRR